MGFGRVQARWIENLLEYRMRQNTMQFHLKGRFCVMGTGLLALGFTPGVYSGFVEFRERMILSPDQAMRLGLREVDGSFTPKTEVMKALRSAKGYVSLQEMNDKGVGFPSLVQTMITEYDQIFSHSV